MIHIFENFSFRRHPWRNMSMSELSELYISMMLRNLALGLIGIFVPIFLYVNGYSVLDIFAFYFVYFFVRTLADIGSGYLVGKIGPKHAMVVSAITQIIASLFIVSLPNFHWPLFIPSAFWALSTSIFYVAYYVDFSKVKHSVTGGSEIGKVTIAEKLGGMLGPIIGGLLAFTVGDQWIFFVAIFIQILSLIPLFYTSEPVKINQKITYRDLPLKKLWRDYFSYVCVLANRNITIVMWPLFLVIYVFQENPYLQMGVIASVGVVFSVASAYTVGKIVDDKKGGQLLSSGAIATGIVNIARPLASSFGGAMFIGTVAESLTNVIQIPLHKAIYDRADSLPGRRIAYLSSLEAFGSFLKFILWGGLVLMLGGYDQKTVIVTGFFIAGFMVFLSLLQKFPALKE